MRKYFGKHAFWTVFGIIFTLYFVFLMIIFFAPRVDLYERGFVACTKNMIQEFSMCQKNKTLCAAKVMLKNHVCDFNVVKTGFSLWLDGKQKTPWENYYFEPVTEEPVSTEAEELKAYYEKHLDMLKEMEELNQKYFELEKKLDASEAENVEMPKQNKGEENGKENN